MLMKVVPFAVMATSVLCGIKSYASAAVAEGTYIVCSTPFVTIQDLLYGNAFPLKDAGCVKNKLVDGQFNRSLAAFGAKIVALNVRYLSISSGSMGGTAPFVQIDPVYDLSGTTLDANSAQFLTRALCELKI